MINRIIKLFPPHHTYVEPFGGAASLLFAKEPAPVECYNDLNGDVVNLFRVLRTPEQFEQFRDTVQLIPYSRTEYDEARAKHRAGGITDPVERAVVFFTISRMSFGGRFGSGFGRVITATSNGVAQIVGSHLRTIERLPDIAERLRMVQVENQSFEQLIPAFDRAETLFYVDPPYIIETRFDQSPSKRYDFEMTAEQHAELVGLLLGLDGKVLLSCYDHAIYEPLIAAGWTRKHFETVSHAAGRTRQSGIQGKGAATKKARRVETLYINPAAKMPEQLDLF